MASLPGFVEMLERTADLHERRPGATPDEIAAAEARLGRPLPESMRSLYAAMNGGDLFQGDARLLELLPGEGDEAFSLVTYSDFLRGAQFPLPPELVAFGSDGTGENFAAWMPSDGAGAPIVVHMGELFEEASFAVVGSDVVSFLTGWCAYYVMSYVEEDADAVLDGLGVPESLRIDPDDIDDERSLDLLRWASPAVAKWVADPYDEPLTPDQVREVAMEVAA